MHIQIILRSTHPLSSYWKPEGGSTEKSGFVPSIDLIFTKSGLLAHNPSYPGTNNSFRTYALEQDVPENKGGVLQHAPLIFGIFYELRKS
jgi:hypothetical protein